jgi:polysaccharide export outer membrane protein
MRRIRVCAFLIAPVVVVGFLLPASPVRAQESSGAAGSEDYVLGVEDKLSISVWKELDLAKTISIRPDGKISFPLVGDIQAAGRTRNSLTEDTRLS